MRWADVLAERFAIAHGTIAYEHRVLAARAPSPRPEPGAATVDLLGVPSPSSGSATFRDQREAKR
jgi:hypothetical protein